MEIELCCQNEINGSQTFLENQDYTINSDFMEIQSEFIEKQEPNQISSTNYEEISHDQNQIQQNNLQSQNEKNQSNDNEGNLNRKSKQSKRKKNNKQVGLMNLYQNINSKNVIRLSSGLLLDLDGTIRFSNSLGFFSFGSSAWQAQNLIYQKQYKVISCSVADVSNQKQISIPDALEILNNMNYYRFGELKEVLSIYEQGKNHVESCLNKISINQDLLKLHDELYEKHIENCEKYVQQYSQQNNIQIFQYCIGRLNLVKKDVEVARCGFSKFYLDFIGLDLDIFNQMLMRQQKIDLIQDKDELFNIFSEGIKKNFLENLNKFDKNFYIKTFDGFSIKIKFRKHDFKPDFKCPSLFLEYLYKFEFIFHITEVDIDLQDLQNLILYRERLSNSQNNLSYDDFIKKELSYLFEDVEYSVHSQAFAEKFYQKNIQKLKIIQKKQVIGKLLQQNKKYCGYKVVNNPSEIKPIQII